MSEIREVLREAADVFGNDNNDVLAVRAVVKAKHETKKVWEQEEVSVKNLIREITKRVEVAREAIPRTESEEEHLRRVEQLESEKFVVAKACNSQEEESRQLEASMKKLQQAIRDLEFQKENAHVAVQTTVPKQRHEISLYAHIVPIKWDYENDATVKGLLSRKGSSDVRPFDLNPKSSSPFFITNYLWSLCE
eukprot:m.44564 g.44564  ORF g.44564 m.44564 type:complete len:193 (-) comp12338_c0_seq1:229-807(-)